MVLEARLKMNLKIQESLRDFNRHFYDQIAEGDKILSRMRLCMKHVAEPNGVALTNEYFRLEMIHIIGIKDGLNLE